MNLATEYLIRTNSFRKLIKYPITIAVEGLSDERFWIYLEEEKDQIKVSQWDLMKIPFVKDVEKWEMCKPHSYYINKDQLFEKNAVIPANCYTLEYSGNSINAEYNEYAHPMDKELYEIAFHNLGKSSNHMNMKLGWLWHNFIKRSERLDHQPIIKNNSEYFSYYKHSLDHLRYSHIYNHWKKFCELTHIYDTGLVYGELAFSNL